MFCQVLFLFLTLKNQNKGDFRTLVLLFQLICHLFAYILAIKVFYIEYINVYQLSIKSNTEDFRAYYRYIILSIVNNQPKS